MSDSGRQMGDCKHARSPDSCVECLRAEVCRLKADDWQMSRLLDWIKNPDRKPSATAFTSGPTRECAFWFEWILAGHKIP